ncbi:MAG: Transposase IS200 like protein [Candidatus Argoarchaeum ethanivorans]|uniref:Transposase IS200 like protein n=1 Tax=Candidatus Argoarchaeum ethanivorans TaxID=2608793 RepID=A0A811T4V1_9EURY|nr:MAG: Transposase IS200 like protein [Candidatus Argoarchaeum ethanivorans]
MAQRNDLHHDRHTVSLLADHMVFSPKYCGKILTGDVALVTEGTIRKTCKEMDIQIIDMAVNTDHVHLFIKYPPKYSISYITNRVKGRSSRVLRKQSAQKRISTPERVVRRSSMGTKLLPWIGWTRMGCR